LIPAATFSMGSAKYPEEGSVHDVQLKTWLESQGRRTSFPKNPELPATQVSWHDAAAYCGWVHKRLPTEAE
jgi:formylglycine-generating enzyme required for sulfatase activity